MKKLLIALVLLIAIVAAGVWFLLSSADGLIKEQIEKQGSKFLGVPVTVFNVDLALTDGRLTISDLDIENPEGFSKSDAFSLDSITLDLGGSTSEPYVVQEVSLNAPEVLYELDASGKGNLLVLKENIDKMLPKAKETPPSEPGANPLVIVENVTIEAVKLKLDFENLPTGDVQLEKKIYEVTLPTFNAGSIGKPNGIPADQVGAAIAKAMLDNVIAKAKEEAKNKIEEEAKKKIKEEVDKKKDELKDKAKDKLKDLLGG